MLNPPLNRSNAKSTSFGLCTISVMLRKHMINEKNTVNFYRGSMNDFNVNFYRGSMNAFNVNFYRGSMNAFNVNLFIKYICVKELQCKIIAMINLKKNICVIAIYQY